MNEKIFKAYDIRGIYPEDLNEEIAYKVGAAFVLFLEKPQKVIVGRDMRLSSPQLSEAFIKGVIEQGVDVIDIGQVSTDTVYFASGKEDAPGVMFTASHNPSQWNGMKFCREGASPIGRDTGLEDIKNLVLNEDFKPVQVLGAIEKKEVLEEYADHALSFINKESIKPLKIAVDAGNGMAGKIIPIVYKKLPCEVIQMYFELDGSFPNHQPSPIEIENVEDLIKKVKEEGCDFGMAFDGDADRIFFIDDKGERISSSIIGALISKQILEKNPNEKIIYNLVCSHIVPDTIKKYTGEVLIEKVGHSYIKQTMKEINAIFATEHSGHYYFRDNYRADSGLIAAVIITEIVSASGKKLSELLEEFNKYSTIEETNTKVEDKEAVINKLKSIYKDNLKHDFDGVSFEFEDSEGNVQWWFNVRPSNTEPLLRLNLEAVNKELMEAKRDEVLKIIRGEL